MEFFTPSILLLLLSAIVLFAIIPQIAPTLLFVIAVLMFIIVGYQHYYMFTDEYAMSTWQNMVAGSAKPLIIVVLVVMMIGFLLNFVPSGRRNVAPELPAYGKNTLKSIIRDPFKTR